MRFSYTIYPIPGKPIVGWYAYRGTDMRHPIAGEPQTPLAEFAELISGHTQKREFLEECKTLGLSI